MRQIDYFHFYRKTITENYVKQNAGLFEYFTIQKLFAYMARTVHKYVLSI